MKLHLFNDEKKQPGKNINLTGLVILTTTGPSRAWDLVLLQDRLRSA